MNSNASSFFSKKKSSSSTDFAASNKDVHHDIVDSNDLNLASVALLLGLHRGWSRGK
jgi:hypothetical protein